ncbi:hypothetical protein, partial [Oleiphilus sp. HI0117]|uniref:hypothetical protein n=1 Tax=Oleiphilus sp. HI0117 TaxID=1822261 RepID=UPI001E46BD2E
VLNLGNNSVSDYDLIKRLKKEFDVESTNALSERLSIPLATITKVERKEGSLPWRARLVILDKLGFAAARRGVEALLPDNLAKKVRDASNSQFLRGIDDVPFVREPECEVSADTILRLITDECSLKVVAPFYEHLNSKYETAAEQSLDQEDRIKLVEILYKADAEKWGKLISQLSSSLSSNRELYIAIELIIHQDEEHAKNVLDFIARAKGAKNTRELCVLLNLTQSQLSRMKNGKTKLTPRVAVEAAFLSKSKNISANEEEFLELDRFVSNPDVIINELL